jgi:zinc D-Ala-D-Ala dipeptidase
MQNCVVFILIFCFKLAFAQPSVIITTAKAYKNSIANNPKNELVNLKKLIPNIVLDLKYASKQNFTAKKLYTHAYTTYMRKEPAQALATIQKELNAIGYGIKIFDAYRPYEATKLMWTLIHDERYVANPNAGSGHNKGTTVDMTIIDLKTGIALNMGTEFDNFTDTAHHTFTANLPQQIIANRNLLKSTMQKFGFKSLETEWWHYGWISTDVYDVLDLSFKQLQRLVN